MSFMGSSLWCLQNSMTFTRTVFFTFGNGISCTSPPSASGSAKGEGRQPWTPGENRGSTLKWAQLTQVSVGLARGTLTFGEHRLDELRHAADLDIHLVLVALLRHQVNHLGRAGISWGLGLV